MRPGEEGPRSRQLRGYVGYLSRGAATHAAYAHAASEQAVELAKAVDAMAANQVSDGEDGLVRHDSDVAVAANRVELLNLQASTHTLGLTVCLVGLSILGALGVEIPDAPPLPEDAG